MSTAIYPRLPHRLLHILGVDSYDSVINWFTTEDDPRTPAQAVMSLYNVFKTESSELGEIFPEDTLMFMARQCYMDTLAWLTAEFGGGLPECTQGIIRNPQAAKDKTTGLLMENLNDEGLLALTEFITEHTSDETV